MRHASVTALLLLCACGAPSLIRELDPATTPALPEGSDAYLEFWWNQCAGAIGQHAVAVRVSASGDEMRVAVLDLDKSVEGWRQLFYRHRSGLSSQIETLELNRALYVQTGPSLRTRIERDLGGLGRFVRPAREGLRLSDGSKVDAFVVGSALVVFPAALTPEQREPVVSTLIFAHAAGLAQERRQGSAAAYRTELSNALAHAGWVTTSFSTDSMARGESVSTGLARASAAETVFKALELSEGR
jgi:hypothetical protein